MGLVFEKEKAGSEETNSEGNTKGDKKKRRGRGKEKDEGISEEKGEENGERKEAKGSERRKKRHSIWFGSSFAKVDKVTADDLIGRGEEGDDTFCEGRGRRIRLRERRGGGGKEEEREKGKRKRQKERRVGNQDDRDSPRDFCPSLPDRQDDLDDFLKARERKSSCQAARSSVPTGEILHFPPGPILPYRLRPRQASPDRKVPLQPPKPASLENKLRQHHPRRRTSLETIEEDPLTFVFRESRMRSYPHEADLTCCVGEAGQPPGFLLTRSVTFSDLTWPGGEGDGPGSGSGNGKGSMEEAGNVSVANEGGTRKVYLGNAEFENDFDDVTETADDANVHIEGERRDHSSYGMTVSVYGVCDVHRGPLFARLHDVTRDEVPEVLQASLEEVSVGWQEDDTYGMLADLFREEDEDRGIDRTEKEIGDEEGGKSDSREKGSWKREDNEVNDRGGTESVREGKVQETASIENRLEMEGDDENETGDEGESERTECEAKGKRKENGEGESQPPIPQLSFHIYIQQQKSVSDGEYPSEERGPGERDRQEAESTNEESSKSEDENHETPSEAGGNEARERPNEAPTWLRQQYRMNLMGAIQSLDTLNDQIVEFIFSGTDLDDSHGGTPKQREALKASMSLMRRLLVDAQSKFRKMVEDNKQLASRIDGDLQTAHQEVNLLRQELADTNRRITQLQAHNQNHDDTNLREDEGSGSDPTTPNLNGSNKYHSESSSNQLAEEMSQLRVDNEKLLTRNRSLQREVEELRRVKTIMEEDVQLKPQINQMTMELTHAKEALSALKADRKRLKAEKFDLLNQMKQLYATLEDKEKELRDFIRNYEQRMKESDESLRQLAAERDETEREKWNILKHARDESERVVKLSAELGAKETTIRKLQEELDAVRKQLISMGYHSDAESVRTNGLPTPTASTPACSPLPLSTPTPTPNGRGSSADSGVRLSSDRDSTASHEVSLRGEDREDRGGDNTPTSAPTHSAASLNSSAMSGLASSNASTGGLSRSAEQLCERLAEAAESSKIRGCSTLTRKSHKGGGTWGSISRVFARQKKRAALDASLYDGSASDKRASWSPSSSLCASPLTEESYSEKLRLLEEAQHIPLERWKAPTVLAWLEVTLGMPQYGAMCAENIRSGKVLLELSDSELESGLGISHPMHRKKLRLAIEELREPRLTRFPRISALNHTWVSSEWLPDLGLPQYADAFANNLVDGRLLEALTKKELEKHLGVHRKFHQASIIHGVHLLRIVRFDRQVLAERRRQCEHVDCDPVVWTNVRWVRWARSVDLAEYADNLKDSGVHGALVVLESSFTADTMATALGIPQSKNIIRRHLATEMEALINPARQQIEEQARFAKMERRRQEKMAAGGSLGRSFSRSYGTGLEKGEKDKRRASLRGSLSRALGLRLREEAAAGNHNGGESSSSGGQSPAVSARTNIHHPHHTRPRSSVMPSAAYVHHETHRRVKSIGDIETITVTPV